MKCCVTVNNYTKKVRYYVGGRRTTRDGYEDFKRGKRVDFLLTLVGTYHTRHYCEVYP